MIVRDRRRAGGRVPERKGGADPIENELFGEISPLASSNNVVYSVAMGLTTILALAVLGSLELVAFYYLWRTNRRIDALEKELRDEIAATRAEMDQRTSALNQRLDEMRESIRAANQRLDETVEARRLQEDLHDINDQVQCLRTPSGMSKRVRRTDHRQ